MLPRLWADITAYSALRMEGVISTTSNTVKFTVVQIEQSGRCGCGMCVCSGNDFWTKLPTS